MVGLTVRFEGIMKRREFITMLGGAVAAWPLSARAQPIKAARIGFLGLVTASSHASRVAAFRAGLRDLGWIEGRNLSIEFRWAEGNYDRLPALAEELLRLNVDVLVTHGAAGALAAKKATSMTPIVITAVGDMLTLGLVSSLSRPGGNITGLSLFAAELTAKRLELVKEAVPSVTRVAILVHPVRAVGNRGDRKGLKGGTESIRGASAGRFRAGVHSHGRSTGLRPRDPRGHRAERKRQLVGCVCSRKTASVQWVS
jgi:putative tryptophan/tyrosine transport system substrate-binding protein